MTDTPDADLLDDYVRKSSDTAFAALAQRHLNLVYASALRQTGNPSAAEEIAQAVFILLARKASTLGRGTVLSGWLYHTTRLTAANWQRAETRRARREQEAYMQSSLQQTESDSAWLEMSPLLDEAMSHLGATDRDALVLRYFQSKTLPEVGLSLGIEERAAQKRVSRALEKLRKIFARRGVVLTTSLITGAISANSVHAAPSSLVASVAAAGTKGPVISATLNALVNATAQTIAWLRIKFAMAIAAPALVVGSAATMAVLVARTSPVTQDGELTTNSPIIMHVQNPPWIKHILFKQSALLMFGQTPSQIDKTLQTELEFEAGLQPSGFYGEMLSPGIHPSSQSTPSERNVFGVSASSVWKVNWPGDLPNQIRQLAVSSRLPGQGGSPDDSVQSSAWIERSKIERINLFGLPGLMPNSFKLGDHNGFEAVTQQGELVQGRYGDVTNDKPHSLAFSVHDSVLTTSRQYVLEYHYVSPEAPLPNRYECTEVTAKASKQSERTTTNWIEEVEYGIDPRITDGYHPSMFFPKLDKITWTSIESNKTRFLAVNNGKFQQVKERTETEVEAGYRRLFPPQHRSRLLYWICGVAILAPILWLVVRWLVDKKP